MEGTANGKRQLIRRRDFLRYSGFGMAAIVIGLTGCGGGGGGTGAGAGAGGNNAGSGLGNTAFPDTAPPLDPTRIVDTLNFTVTDAVKEMVTHEPTSPFPSNAECYYWVLKEDRFPADCPGPQVYALEGDRIALNVTNSLEAPHAFCIPGMVDTGPIAPGARWSGEFEATIVGTHLYHDNLNAPVNRVMGMHGVFVVMPREAASGHRYTPYKNPTPGVQQLFDDFGSVPWWPGLSWQDGDTNAASFVEPFRQYTWLTHQASPVLFAEVGRFCQDNPGREYSAAQFVDLFLNDPFVATSTDPRVMGTTTEFNRKPHFFTVTGGSGHYAHNNCAITPMHRVGEPCIIRLLNAGLMTHSMHLHANHFFVTGVNNEAQENPLWLDVFNLHPMDTVDYTIPYMRPPDIPNQRGIGRADAGLLTQFGAPSWPPVEEFDRHYPPIGTMVTDWMGMGQVDIAQRQSPLCYPMHDHSEPSQTAQGGNYNCGLISGIYFMGDRNGMMNFPVDQEFQHMLAYGRHIGETGPAPGYYMHDDDGHH